MTSQSHPYQQVSPRNDQNIGHPPHTMPTSSDPADLFLQEFPELAKLSREDLEEALRTPAYFDALFGTLPSVKAIYDEHESFLQRNVDITAANTGLRSGHEALKAETEAVFEEAQRLQGRWHQHTAPQQDSAYTRFAGQAQLTRLRQAFGDQDRLSESLISSLLEGTLSPDDFAKQFKEVRRVWYRRQLQTEKWLNGQVQWQ